MTAPSLATTTSGATTPSGLALVGHAEIAGYIDDDAGVRAVVALGISRSEFLDVLSRYRVSAFQVDDEDLGAGLKRG